jgi:hypothetical protein
MKQTVIWLTLALLFAIGVTLSFTADSFGPTATSETTGLGPATVPAAPLEPQHPVAMASAKPAEPEVPVAMLDDVPPRRSIGAEELARWQVVPAASPAPPATEAPVAPLPLAPTTTATIAGQPGQGSKAGINPPRSDARSARKPQDSNAQLPGKRRTANARACGSSSRFSDLLRQLKLTSRCPTRRSPA